MKGNFRDTCHQWCWDVQIHFYWLLRKSPWDLGDSWPGLKTELSRYSYTEEKELFSLQGNVQQQVLDGRIGSV